ncbi:YcbK family protein [Undibacterium sp. TC4M20W]|uniref:YcbK family protein n=1 Tax=Undibacterium sp. TC4M20W TaxID=3413052 RepID=UPI003BF1109B
MTLTRRQLLKKGLLLGTTALAGPHAILHAADIPNVGNEKHAQPTPPPDLFDSQALDIEFWVKPRTMDLIRPATGERSKILYWKDGEVLESAYQQLCHILRDVNGKETAPIDPKLLETLWATQAYIARFGMTRPLEILSGYRTKASNTRLIEQGVPAARKSLHMEGKAADIRIPQLHEEILGELIQSFRQGGVGFYYRQTAQGGWIHTDTGLQRSWKG